MRRLPASTAFFTCHDEGAGLNPRSRRSRKVKASRCAPAYEESSSSDPGSTLVLMKSRTRELIISSKTAARSPRYQEVRRATRNLPGESGIRCSENALIVKVNPASKLKFRGDDNPVFSTWANTGPAELTGSFCRNPDRCRHRRTLRTAGRIVESYDAARYHSPFSPWQSAVYEFFQRCARCTTQCTPVG